MYQKKIIGSFLLAASLGVAEACLTGCKINYSFSGASISPEIKTISIQYFPNHADIIQPSLSQDFTDALKDRVKSQTRLSFMNEVGDVDFSGEITNYSTQPVAITGAESAALNRLTITVKVKYTNVINPDQNFDTNFSRYADYSSSQSLNEVEADLIKQIVDQLTEDIFNRAFVNW
jgi:hypothetical protein